MYILFSLQQISNLMASTILTHCCKLFTYKKESHLGQVERAAWPVFSLFFLFVSPGGKFTIGAYRCWGAASLRVGIFWDREEQGTKEPGVVNQQPLTLNDNKVSLWADPLDSRRSLELVAVRVVGCPALVRPRVIESEACEVNGARGVGYVCGINVYALVPCPVVQLGIGFIVFLPLYKPPLHLRDGVSYHLAVQLRVIVSKPELGQGRFDEAG